MTSERMPSMPAKSRLSWQIARLRLDATGRVWFATGVKRERVAVVALPSREEAPSEEAWLASIEAAFEYNAHDAFEEPAGVPGSRDLCAGTKR
jgi:hypothetical protein